MSLKISFARALVILCEHSGVNKWLEGGADKWKMVFIFYSDFVQPAVINTRSQAAIFLTKKTPAARQARS